jgi:FkbM family methyltransferase
MISYAQNAEDVVLARGFQDQPWGFYIDVGANHPEWDSVTRHFYDRGWRGVNIEPMRREHALLLQDRPGDVNLQCALGASDGTMTLYETPMHTRGTSTVVPGLAQHYRDLGEQLTEVSVPVTTLGSVCERWVTGAVDFLKIDVEGFEEPVIRGGDWEHFRPRVVIVEAIDPVTRLSSHADWEQQLLDAEYRLALFDGLNRFYVQQDETELHARISVPANVLDGYVSLRQATERATVRSAIEKLQAVQHLLESDIPDVEA